MLDDIDDDFVVFVVGMGEGHRCTVEAFLQRWKRRFGNAGSDFAATLNCPLVDTGAK